MSITVDLIRSAIGAESAGKVVKLLATQSPVIVLIVFLAVLFGQLLKQNGKSKKQNKPKLSPQNTTVSGSKRALGTWDPSNFKAPEPSPYPNWSITETKPLPYRPVAYKYHVTMGIRTMKWDEWIELDNEWPKYHQRKLERLEERGTQGCSTLPPAMDAAYETLELFRDYLPSRYPSLFKRTDVGIDNIVTGESFNIMERPLKEDPMAIAAKLVQDDLALMIEKPDGQYYLLGGAILLAGFWRLSDKIGMPLSEIHTSGDVPKFREKLKTGMERFFFRLKPEGPVVRNNYFIQTDDDVAWSHAIGPENNEQVGWDYAKTAETVDTLHFRSERQSLRRLPRSGAVLFTIRTYFVPITQVCKEPYVPGRMAENMRTWTDDVAGYKGLKRYKDVLLPYLDKKNEEQIVSGIISGQKDNFPF